MKILCVSIHQVIEKVRNLLALNRLKSYRHRLQTLACNYTESLMTIHPRAQAARGSGVMLYFGLYHSCRISAVQSDCRTGHTSRFMLHPPPPPPPPELHWQNNPRGPLNPRQTSTLMIVRHQTYVIYNVITFLW